MRPASMMMADYVRGIQHCLDQMPTEQIAFVAEKLLTAYQQDRCVAVVGNGGSASTASHMACDLTKTIIGSDVERMGHRFRVMALTDNMAVITAWANDVGYETIFAEQLKCWIQPDDLVIVLSGSGNSANIYKAVKAAKALGAYTIGFLGFNGGLVHKLLDTAIIAPGDNYGYVEDFHLMFCHMITAYLRQAINPSSNGKINLQLDPYYDHSTVHANRQ